MKNVGNLNKGYDSLTQSNKMRLIKECLHCGREFQDISSPFCSSKCAKEVTGT
jgi:hypothetical protein